MKESESVPTFLVHVAQMAANNTQFRQSFIFNSKDFSFLLHNERGGVLQRLGNIYFHLNSKEVTFKVLRLWLCIDVLTHRR